jgi:hypothetical protein
MDGIGFLYDLIPCCLFFCLWRGAIRGSTGERAVQVFQYAEQGLLWDLTSRSLSYSLFRNVRTVAPDLSTSEAAVLALNQRTGMPGPPATLTEGGGRDGHTLCFLYYVEAGHFFH